MKGTKFAVAIAALLLSASAWAQERQFDVPPMDAVHGISEFARQAGIQIVAPADGLSGINTPAIHGNFDVRTALKKLLVGTDLEIASDNGTIITLRRHASATKRSASVDSALPASSTAAAVGASSQGLASQGISGEISEIIVTAQKKLERLQDVPIPVTVLSGEVLTQSNQLRLQDYYQQVPGLAYTTDFRGAPSITIRGLSTGTGFQNPTVGIVVDDVPYGSSSGLAAGGVATDIDPSDLQQVEVLRGPQGTLYGANSLGGLIKFVTIDPSTEKLTGRIQAGTSAVYNGAEPGYAFRGSVNIPVSETVAIRASAFARQDPGYIDDVLTGQKGINKVDAEGGRIAALWKPSELLSIKLSALYQYSNEEGANRSDFIDQYNPPRRLGDLQQSAARDTGYLRRRNEVYTANIKFRLGIAEIQSISGYSISDINDSAERTQLLGPTAAAVYGPEVTAGEITDHATTKKLSQELILTMPIGDRIDWLIGGFYTHEKSPYVQAEPGLNPITGEVAGTLAAFDFPTTFSEAAIYTDVTFRITNSFDVQIGGRESRNRQTYSEVDRGVFFPTGLAINPLVTTNDDSFTYLLTPRFKFSPDLMTYARIATGYRPGGPNSTCILLGVPCSYGPDKTSNYEIGLKGDVADHLLDFDASIYYIDWRDIQLALVKESPSGSLGYYANGSRAKSQGAELTLNFRPVKGVRFGASLSYSDAVLTQALPPSSQVSAPAGSRLPFSSRVSGSLSADYDFHVSGDLTGFVGASVAYVGDRYNSFGGAGREILPPYERTEVHGGFRYKSWSADIFVNNALDERGILSGTFGALGLPAVTYVQPRTVGLNLSWAF